MCDPDPNFLPALDEYEVRVHDGRPCPKLVAAIEIFNPSNKVRPDRRRAFAAKVDAVLQCDVRVSLVDLITVRQFNLYADLFDLLL